MTKSHATDALLFFLLTILAVILVYNWSENSAALILGFDLGIISFGFFLGAIREVVKK